MTAPVLERAGQPRRRLVIVGSGMVSHALVEKLVARDYLERHDIVVLGEEPRLAYDRVHLSNRFAGDGESLAIATPEAYQAAGVVAHTNERVVAIGRDARAVTCASGRTFGWDALVLATGSRPFVPELPGRELPGCFVYRTIEDVDAIRAYAAGARRAIVIGGGLLGLEAAGGLVGLGLDTHVVELMPRLMAAQLDDAGGAVLRAKIEALGVHVHTGASSSAVLAGADGRVCGLRLADGTDLAAELIVFSAGIRPRDELARAAGLAIGARGGVAIDTGCRTSDPAVLAIGECAAFGDRCFGLVAPGYQMAEVAASSLTGGAARFSAPDLSTQLKLIGVDVAAIGDGMAETPGAHALSFLDPAAGVYKKLVVSADRKRLLGAILVGDARAFGSWLGLYRRGAPLPGPPEELLVPARALAAATSGVAGMPADATICSCLNIAKHTICAAVTGQKLTTLPAVKACTKAGTGCGSCVPLIAELLASELLAAGLAVNRDLCEHFAHTRQELFHLIKVGRLKSFEAVIARHGSGAGCEVCKPTVGSILASAWNEHVLDRKHLPLQDTNDRFLANIQRDGSYSVVPRVPAGEITPDQLIVLGQVAKRYSLYTKITGGQRVDLFGARVEQLPEIWRELIAAGFESGHAYGKALRTVKSCVGSTWCRYGVQDSVGFALALEHRYKGLRSPHKLKGAVSGCARECAEAQSKDFGVIATEKGYNLYLCGNGGMKPQHAQLFAVDLDEASVIRYLDRFLMFYIRTADRLQRTATWFTKLEGGMDYLRRVIIDDELGIGAELEADMAHQIATYECEWKATLEDPEKLVRFRPFVNAAVPDPSIVFLRERGQPRPATSEEKSPPRGAVAGAMPRGVGS